MSREDTTNCIRTKWRRLCYRRSHEDVNASAIRGKKDITEPSTTDGRICDIPSDFLTTGAQEVSPLYKKERNKHFTNNGCADIMPTNKETKVLDLGHDVHNEVKMMTETDVSAKSKKEKFSDASNTDEADVQSIPALKKEGNTEIQILSSNWETVSDHMANCSFDVSKHSPSDVRKRWRQLCYKESHAGVDALAAKYH